MVGAKITLSYQNVIVSAPDFMEKSVKKVKHLSKLTIFSFVFFFFLSFFFLFFHGIKSNLQCVKCSSSKLFLILYFPLFGLNVEIWKVNKVSTYLITCNVSDWEIVINSFTMKVLII